MLVNSVMAMMEKRLLDAERKLQRQISRLRRRLVQLPVGCLSIKRLRGGTYAYLVRRSGARLRFSYQGPADTDAVRRLHRLIDERRRVQKELRRAGEALAQIQRALAPLRAPPGLHKSASHDVLPTPLSKQNLGEVAPRVLASMALVEGRRSFAFL